MNSIEFSGPKILLLIFPPFRNVKNILGSQAIQNEQQTNQPNKRTASRLDLSHDHSLLTSGINQAMYPEFTGDLGNF